VFIRVLPVLLRCVFGLCCSIAFVQAAYADKAIDLYTADVLVINQTSAVRNRAAVNELASVFVRMSGSRGVLQNPVVSNAIKNASRYVDQFSYRSTNQEITLAGTTYPASVLLLNFAPSPLEAILREAQLPFWPANRPEVLIWMAHSGDRQQYVEKNGFLGRALSRAASERGLPTVMPLLDLQDRNILPVAKIWAADERSIVNAAKRYTVDAVISGRIRKQNGGYVANFILNHQGESHYLQTSADSQQALADNIIDEASRFFANIYAVTTNGSDNNNENLQLVVNNSESFPIYAKVLQYLQSVTLIENAQLITVDDNELIFEVSHSGSVAQLQQTLALDKKLIFVEQKTAYEKIITPLESPSTQLQPITEDGLDDVLDISQPLPPVVEERAIQQLVFTWQ